MMVAVAVTLGLMLLIMAAAWVTVLWSTNGGWIDVFWTFGTGACGVVCALAPWAGPPDHRQFLVAWLVFLWSTRLGWHIALRVATSREDSRYARLKAQWGVRFERNLFGLALVQAPATTLLCASIAAAALRPSEGLRASDFVGAAILAVAIFGEALADVQLRRFKADPANRGKVMDRGLWAWSRHPNYFFEWLGWLAYPVIAIDLTGAWPQGWAGLIAPAVMYGVLTRLTGVPPLEAAMLETKGAAYGAYQDRVSPFFLLPPKKGRAR